MTTREIDWASLSPRARDIVSQVALRVEAGYSHEEIATVLQRTRPQTQALTIPERVTGGWVSARLRELRQEIDEQEGTA